MQRRYPALLWLLVDWRALGDNLTSRKYEVEVLSSLASYIDQIRFDIGTSMQVIMICEAAVV